MKCDNIDVFYKFASFEPEAREKLECLRALIFEVSIEEKIDKIEETLKWGQPSYLSKKGSAIRIDWNKNRPKQYSLYFDCKTKLISTFKEIYPSTFKYAGNREIIFELTEVLPIKELKHCIALSLNYHEIKKLPLLGA